MKSAMHLLLTLLAIVTSSGAFAQDTVVSVASSQPDLSTFVAALETCPEVLAQANATTTAVTVFAPNNAAFAAFLNNTNMTASELLANTLLLCATLEFHIVAGAIPASAAANATQYLTTLTGANTTIQLLNGAVFVNNARVTIPDLHAGAAIIHVIDAVISETPSLASVLGTYSEVADFVQFAAAYLPRFIPAAAANPDNILTLFVPSNGALASGLSKIAAGLGITVEEAITSTEFIAHIFDYHALYQTVFNTSTLTGFGELRLQTILDKAHISLRLRNGIVLVNQYTRVEVPDVAAGNAIFHIINKVLLPTNYQSYYMGTPVQYRKMMARGMRMARSIL